MSGKPTSRIIYMDGIDTGLRAYTRNQAITSMLRVLRRRGRFDVTEAVLSASYSTGPGRVDFATLPAQARTEDGHG